MSKKPEKFSELSDQTKGGILIIDSGLGSISLLKEVRKVLPHTPITVIADSAEFPYGQKKPEEIVDRVCYLAEYFLPATGAATLLLACNTASTVALPALRKKFNIPVVGIVPAVKPASVFSKSGTIALLATPETARGPYVDELINAFASHCEVIKIGCPNLAYLAEQKVLGEYVSLTDIKMELAPLLNHQNFAKVDAVLLGCTHFPFLNNELEEIFGSSTKIFDPAPAVARQVHKVHANADAKGPCFLIYTGAYKEHSSASLCVDSVYYL